MQANSIFKVGSRKGLRKLPSSLLVDIIACNNKLMWRSDFKGGQKDSLKFSEDQLQRFYVTYR